MMERGWPLRLYPPSFRERYGPELSVLIDDLDSGPVTVDLLRGAALAWLRPVLPGAGPEMARRRLQATVSTAWVAWCVGFMTAPAATRALLDPPVAGADQTVHTLLDVAQVAFFTGGALAFIAGFPLAIALLRPALRTGDRRLIAPLAPLGILGAVEAAGLGLLAILRRGHPPTWLHPSIPFVLVGTLWIAGFGAFVIAGALGPPVVLTRARPDGFALRWAVAVGALVSLALLVIAGVCVATFVIAGPGLFGIPVIIVAATASATAVTSGRRGVAALSTA